MKKTFFAGLITLFPLALTLIIVVYFLDLFTNPFIGIVQYFISEHTKESTGILHNRAFVLFLSRLIVIAFLICLIFVAGFLARKLFFNMLLNLTNKIFSKIPVVKSVYRFSSEIASSVFQEIEQTFKQTVLIPFPAKETHSIGLVIGEIPPGLKKVIKEESLSVFVPTAPHPLSGYILFSAKKELIDVEMGVEEAFKFIISCGTYHPPQSSTPPESK